MAQFIFASFVIIIARQPAWHAQRDIVLPWVPTIRPSNVGVVGTILHIRCQFFTTSYGYQSSFPSH